MFVGTALEIRPIRTALCFAMVVLVAACSEDDGDDITAPTESPVPTLSSLSHTEVLVGTSGLTVTIEGSGFIEDSQVLVDGVARSHRRVSETILELPLGPNDVDRAGSLTIAVRNPAPGGGLSESLELAVLNPDPVLSSLDQTEILVGSESRLVSLTGSGFVPQSQVLVGGVARGTTFLTPTSLQVDLLESDVAVAADLSISVRNAAPGGGTSSAMSLAVVNPEPELLVLPSRGAAAGSSGFTLYVHGRNFVSSTVVFWNGEPRTTQVVGPTRLRATIHASDVTAAGEVVVELRTPPPGGGSATASFHIRTVGSPAATSVERLSMVGRHLVSDPVRDRIYVSLRSNAPLNANSVVRVDPASGSVTDATFVGSDPGRLAISDDASVLYVGLDGAGAVRRLDLGTFSPGIQWALPASEVAGDLEVQPGSPGTAIVSRHRPGYSPSLQGVTVYDDGVARAGSSSGHTGGSRIAVLDEQDSFYGYNNAHTGFEFFTIALTEDGATHERETRSLITGFYTDIVADAGRVYGSDGSVVDAELHERVAGLQSGHAVRPDPETGRVYVLGDEGIRVFDLNTFAPLGTIPLAGYSFEHPANAIKALVRWGDDGLAFLDADELILVRSPIVATVP